MVNSKGVKIQLFQFKNLNLFQPVGMKKTEAITVFVYCADDIY